VAVDDRTSAEDRAPRFLGVFAHPDDEVFCAGGTLAKYVAQGAEAMVISSTRGEAGQIRDAKAATRQTLGKVREQELRMACRRLGVQRVECLDYRDGTLRDVSRREMVAVVLEHMRDFDPDVVVTFGDDGAYGHPDHIAMSLATTEACTLVNDLRGREGSGRPVRLYHSHFPRSRLLLLDRLASWLDELATRFRGNLEFVHSLAIFSQETTTLGYASDHVGVGWFPAGSYIIEQGEPADRLYLLLGGEAEVMREEPDGTLRHLARVGPGEFVGERGLARGEPRSAHVVANDNVTCLVFSPEQPALFAGRGADATLPSGSGEGGVQPAADTSTTCIDVSDYVDRKVEAVAAYRTQYPIDPSMFPETMLSEMFSKEYFVRIYPPMELESDLFPGFGSSASPGSSRA
jgi:LmbE family N-acetylglucosaminyl deacetylase